MHTRWLCNTPGGMQIGRKGQKPNNKNLGDSRTANRAATEEAWPGSSFGKKTKPRRGKRGTTDQNSEAGGEMEIVGGSGGPAGLCKLDGGRTKGAACGVPKYCAARIQMRTRSHLENRNRLSTGEMEEKYAG
jgi:hypothetical protein